MKLFFVFSMLTMGFMSSQADARSYQITGDSEFIATGKPGFIKIDGLGSGVTGKLEIKGSEATGEASFPLDTLATGVSLRDKHMKDEYLEVSKYPLAKLTITTVKFSASPENDGFSQTQVPFAGMLTVHGVSRQVNGTIDVSTDKGITQGEAHFPIKISDFGFPEPKFMGVKVNNDVEVKVKIKTQKARTA